MALLSLGASTLDFLIPRLTDGESDGDGHGPPDDGRQREQQYPSDGAVQQQHRPRRRHARDGRQQAKGEDHGGLPGVTAAAKQAHGPAQRRTAQEEPVP